MNTLDRHTQAYESKTIPRLDADFWLYRTLWVELGPLRATLVFWAVRIWGGWMYGKRRTSNAGGEGRGLPRTSPPPCSQVVCPLSATCKKDEDGCNAHCEPHAKGEGCDFGADGCPPCVPCTANARLDRQEEAR